MFATTVEKNSEKMQRPSSMSTWGERKYACTTHLTAICPGVRFHPGQDKRGEFTPERISFQLFSCKHCGV